MPPTHVFQSEINDRREAEHDHEKLQHFRVNRRSQAAFQDINQNNAGANQQAEIVIPAKKLAEQFRQRVHRNARRENRHYGEGDGVQSADAFVKTHLQILRHRARLGAVIKGHHEHREENHRRNRADPVKVRGGDAVFRAAGGHADKFKRAEIGRDEGQAGHPRRNRARRREKIRRRFHVTRQHPADADDKGDIGQQNGVVNFVEMHWFHKVWRRIYRFLEAVSN